MYFTLFRPAVSHGHDQPASFWYLKLMIAADSDDEFPTGHTKTCLSVTPITSQLENKAKDLATTRI